MSHLCSATVLTTWWAFNSDLVRAELCLLKHLSGQSFALAYTSQAFIRQWTDISLLTAAKAGSSSRKCTWVSSAFKCQLKRKEKKRKTEQIISTWTENNIIFLPVLNISSHSSFRDRLWSLLLFIVTLTKGRAFSLHWCTQPHCTH